ncbi:MAG: cation:proton antiporter [Lentisphaeria bacterium]|nr:cation:proton antiporter [Lentisphaeria bacterium]
MLKPYWLAIAFVAGLIARRFGLPALVGFLATGFILRSMGVEHTPQVQRLADLGVLLMLFMIGLKLHVRSLLQPVIWASSTLHMITTVTIFTVIIKALGHTGIPLISDLDWNTACLVAFALSFSSTVFAVVVYEQKAESAAFHAVVGIGILIMQDIFAVLFMTISKGLIPSPFALTILLLIPGRKWLCLLLEKTGRGELQILIGLLFPAAGYVWFEAVNLKGDLGALIMGIVLASSPAAKSLAKTLMSFKDLYLVTFFLSIGLHGDPNKITFLVAIIFIALLPIKMILFEFFLMKFKLRARTSTFTSFSLSNYSEFGLIIAALAVNYQWLNADWLLVLAVTLSLSYVIGAPLAMNSAKIYRKINSKLVKFETEERLPEEQALDLKGAETLIFGMGRVGHAAYDVLRDKLGNKLHGLDVDINVVENHDDLGRCTGLGDPTDKEFWQRIDLSRIKLIIFTLPCHEITMRAIELLKATEYKGQIAVVIRFKEDAASLNNAGVNFVYNISDEAGSSFAKYLCKQLKI